MRRAILFFKKNRPVNGLPSLLTGLFFALLFQNCGKEKFPLALTEQKLPTELDIAAVAFFDENRGVAVGGDTWSRGEIFSTEDGGANWRLDTFFGNAFTAACFDPMGGAYAVGSGGQVFLKRNLPNARWEMARQDWTFSRGCSFLNEKKGLVVSGAGFIGGRAQRLGPDAVWQEAARDTFPQELAAVQWIDSSTAVACGYGIAIRSADGGLSWKRLGVEGDFFTALHFPTAETGYLVGKFGTILKSTDGGLSFKKIRDGGQAGRRAPQFNAVFFEDGATGWAAGDDGLLWKTTDGGSNWLEAEGTPGGLDFTGIFVKNQTGWLAATGGRLFRF